MESNHPAPTRGAQAVLKTVPDTGRDPPECLSLCAVLCRFIATAGNLPTR